MPKIPDDMSDEAKARRAQMSKLTREAGDQHRIQRPMQEDGTEIERIARDLGLEPGAMVFMCNRGR